MPVRHLFFAAAAVTTLLACEPTETGMTRDEVALQEVREASQAYVEVLRRLDHDGAAAAWAEDALLMPSGAPDLVGGPAIHAMMSENYPELRFVELDIRSTEVEISGDLAFEVTHYEERIGMPNGDDLNLSGRVLFVWRREPSGEWKILRGMYNYTS